MRHIPFIAKPTANLIVWSVLTAISLILVLSTGPNYFIDFLGGVILEVRLPEGTDPNRLLEVLRAPDFGVVSTQQVASTSIIRVVLNGAANPQEAGTNAQQLLAANFPGVAIVRADFVGPVVAHQLLVAGLSILSVTLSLAFLWSWIRFGWLYFFALAVTLVPEVTALAAAFAVTQAPFTFLSLFALSEVAWVSVAQKLVLFRRVRTNLHDHVDHRLRDVIESSIRERRWPLFIAFAVGLLASTSFQMIFGVFLVSVSSIFVAPAVLALLGKMSPRLAPAHV